MFSKILATRLCLLFLILFSSLSAEEHQPPRIAVLSSDKSGSGDLLMARLSANPAVSLVERNDLGNALDELELKELLGDRKKRSRFGEILGADFLVLLSMAGNRTRLVVCDTHLGVTLQDQSIGIAEQPHDKVLGVLAETALQTIHSFADGVKQVVAVPDFLCRDLTFDFIYLQSDYAEVMRSAYRQIPGTALVAIEEAKAIAVERDTAGLGEKDRLVSVFIEGEYRTKRDLQSGGVSVEITLRARDSGKVLMERKLPPVALSQTGRELMSVFTKDLAVTSGTGETLINEAAQYRMLVERAEAFSALGEFLRSTELREAALLLKPDADDQRIQLVREYTRRSANPYEASAWPKDAKYDDSNPLWVAAFTRAVNDWKRSLQHCSHLVLNRRLSREEATDLTYHAIHSITGVRAGSSDRLGDCETLKKDFIRHVFARIAHLDPAPPEVRSRLTGALDVYHFVFESALMRCDGNFLTAEDLGLIVDLLTRLLPDSMWPSYRLNFMLRHYAYEFARQRDASDGLTGTEFHAFLDQLTSSARPLVRVYGRYGKLCFRMAKDERSPALLEEARGMFEEAKGVGFDLREYDYFMGQLRNELLPLEYALRQETAPTVPAPPEKKPVAHPVPKSRVSLKPIQFRLAETGRKGEPLPHDIRESNFRPLADRLDAFWSRGSLYFMRSPGIVKRVLAGENLSIADVVSDGRHVWVASFYDWGLSVLDFDGKELTRIGTEQGLPPRGLYGLVIHPISPGRVLVSGSFGNESRGWIAVVRFDGNKGEVQVIHEATKVPDYKKRDSEYAADPKMAFVPAVAIHHVTGGPKPRRFIILQKGHSGSPLTVDLETLEVSVLGRDPDDRESFLRSDPPGNAFLSIDGTLWVAGSIDDFCSFRLNEEGGYFQAMRKRPSYHAGNGTSGSMARHGDWLYYAGYKWRRIHLRTGKEELLINDTRALPHYGSGNAWRLWNSSHYGLVAFCEHKGELYRVEITL